MTRAPYFTVFTPTYNRAHTLPAVYASLVAQTERDFEWVVVDDGSTDDTAALVGTWAEAAPFPIRLLRQPNGGKHRAFNCGVAAARGELFVPLDSDDVCRPAALERFRALWDAIPAAERDGFSGVTVLCDDPSGQVIGRPFPEPVVDARPAELVARGGYVGDKWGFHRTDVLRAHPFPEIPGERFIAESVVWNRIGRRYRMRFVNEVLQRKEYRDDGLTRSSLATRVRSPRGAALAYRELLDEAVGARYKLRTLVNYGRFMRHAGEPWPRIIAASGAPLLACAAAPAAELAFRADRGRLRRAAR